jgi:D-lactate dehydrogenase
MKIAVFSAREYDKKFLLEANKNYNFEFIFFEETLHEKNAHICSGFDAICVFVTDIINENIIKILSENKIKAIAIRATGINNIDLKAASKYNIKVVNVPGYSPHSVAEYSVAMLLSMTRHIPQAFNRVKDRNFSLSGLMGFDIFQKTVGIVGLGRIGQVAAKIFLGFGCKVIAYDPHYKGDLKDVILTDLKTLFKEADIISLYCNLTHENMHMINKDTLKEMKDGVIIVNTARGALIDKSCLIDSLKSKKIGYLALDVYEEEENFFYKDLSSNILYDDIFARLITFPNVFISSHQAFFTKDALDVIAKTTLENLDCINKNQDCKNDALKKNK